MADMDFKILVVDDDIEYAETCARTIARAGYQVYSFGTTSEALKAILLDEKICLVLSDLKMPDKDGIQFLKEIKKINASIEVIIMTGYGTIVSAVKAIKEKAADYITKPFNKDELLNAILKVYKVWKLNKEVRQLKQVVSKKLHLDGFVFKNNLMTGVYDRMVSASRSNCSVFISGESGTGKELIARAIHNSSFRSSGPFVPINCSALSSQLIESELFGYRRGAFTGADRNHDGLFVAAEGGTLFLDEIVEMQTDVQVKLLRAIQEKLIRPVGFVEEKSVDIRFIAATNMNIKTALSKKLLREDLYHRLNVIEIEVPPLRKMQNEIPDLLNYFLKTKSKIYEHKIQSITAYAMKLLTDYSWPGNIRETENVVERFLAEGKTDIVDVKYLPQNIKNQKAENVKSSDTIPSFSEAEKSLIEKALKEANWNKTKAALILGISRPRLYKKIELYNIKQS
ncbi:MAG: sigma-54-dependent transcriptional regulator [Candidatus Zixiibacteriota bacterium]